MGWAFKNNTNDTRESAAIYIADDLINEQAKLCVFDPKVTEMQMLSDLDYLQTRGSEQNKNHLAAYDSAYKACLDVHAIAILTEWDEFKEYDWQRIYENMQKPAFLFDGRNLLDRDKMSKIGFIYQGIGT